MNLRRLILSVCLTLASAVVPVAVSAAGGGVHLDSFTPSDSNRALRRGARTFMNYCMGCHSAEYHRYGRMAKDIGLSDEFVAKNLIFTTDSAGEPSKIGSLMANNMTAEYGKEAFGVVPPDLTLVARSRGVDWLYTYMRSFYIDESRPFGANNTVFPQVGMPHVLADLQGWQKPVYEAGDDGEKEVLAGFQPVTAGQLSPAEYDSTVSDLVSFLDYLGDPNRRARHAVGFWVMLFLLVFLALAIMLKKEYWKDVQH